MSGFSVAHDRSVSQDIGCVRWCNEIDLVAIVVGSVELHVHRLMSWQRVAAPERSSCEISAVEWGPGGRLLAFGDVSGAIRIFKIESGDVVLPSVNISSAITSLMWIMPKFADSELDWDYTHEHETSALKANVETFDVLVVGDETGRLQIRSFRKTGLVNIVQFYDSVEPSTLVKLRFISAKEQAWRGRFHLWDLEVFHDSPVSSLRYRPDLTELGVVSEQARMCKTIDTRVMADFRNELKKIGCEAVTLVELTKKAKNALEGGYRFAKSASELYEHINPLEKILEDYDEESSAIDVLRIAAAGGIVSPALKHFFEKELSIGALTKFLRTLNSQFTEASEKLREDLMNCAEDIIYRASYLTGLATLKRFEGFLVSALINLLLEQGSELLNSTYEANLLLSKSWNRCENFCRFLERRGPRPDGETQDELHVDDDEVLGFLDKGITQDDDFDEFLGNNLEPLVESISSTIDRIFGKVSSVLNRSIVMRGTEQMGDSMQPLQHSASCREDGTIEVALLEGSAIKRIHPSVERGTDVGRNDWSPSTSGFRIQSIAHYRQGRLVFLGSSDKTLSGNLREIALAVCEESVETIPWCSRLRVKSGTPVSLHVSVGRGLASLVIGKRRFLTYDLEDLIESDAASS
ncbi:hypothetical protein NDN08_002267 [Rhodosorus marinus]|uniref:Anaphase-promoting complex subunit 4 n=1 Tax=Rhodosorus marinus TaxID=101924 RepID=A0AAV8UWT9_9RHOD|nr:hypothetical protein NDN08_002267 [Rhodosorus marinus]